MLSAKIWPSRRADGSGARSPACSRTFAGRGRERRVPARLSRAAGSASARIAHALGRRSAPSYDAVEQPVTYTDQKGQLATLTFNNRYELTGEQYADGTRMTYSFDGVGQLRTVVDGTGWHTMTYNRRRDLVVTSRNSGRFFPEILAAFPARTLANV